MALFLLLVMLTACAAEPQDLTGRMFTFPQETNTAHVKLPIPIQRLNAVTVCLRTFSDLTRGHVLFSMATRAHHNSFLIFRNAENEGIGMYVGGVGVAFPGVSFQQNTWHSICATWDSDTGLGQVWLDGKPSSRKYITSGTGIGGAVSIIVGQAHEADGGRFNPRRSFVGMMSDVHMWNHVITPCEIENYAMQKRFPAGDVLQWGALNLEVIGNVLVERKQLSCA